MSPRRCICTIWKSESKRWKLSLYSRKIPQSPRRPKAPAVVADPAGTSLSLPHKTRPIKVWVDADLGIADMVEYLNTIPGVRTQASCQGTIGEGGPHPYRAQVMCTWNPEALPRLQAEFDVDVERLGNGSWGYVRPREGA